MAALTLVAGSLFALRYGLTRRLDLRQPLANFLPESFTGGKPVQQAKNARRNAKQMPETPDDGSAAANPGSAESRPAGAQPGNSKPGEAQNETIAKMDTKSLPEPKTRRAERQPDGL